VTTASDGAPVVVRRLSDLPGGAVGERTVALTFDDGPHPEWTPQILDTLATRDTLATFFVLGELAAEHPHLVERMIRDGHSVGNHSWSHERPDAANDVEIELELQRTDELLRDLTGGPVRYFRPPYRRTDAPRYAETLARRGMVAVLWSIDPRDWRGGTATEISDAVVGALRPGAIVLLHDGGRHRRETVMAVPLIIDGARALGYRFVAM
jgi:peptidoglycan-N-acetylglucosamine deacetylase